MKKLIAMCIGCSGWTKIASILILIFIGSLLQGCQLRQRRGLNELKGEHLDRVNYHRQAIHVIDPQIYLQNQRVIPMINDQVGDSTSWQQRMGKRMSGMGGGK